MSQAVVQAPRRGLAIASLALGIIGLPTIGLVGIGALVGIVLGIVALVKAGREPAVYGGKGMAVAGIALCVLSVVVMPFILGIVAAIAIPSLLRARVSANEAATIGDIRAIISAQAQYQSANGGFYDRLECLAAYAIVAVPATRNQTGVRSFCGDATGRICYEPDGADIAVVDGVCPSDCDDLR